MGNNTYSTFQSTVQTLVNLNLMPADVAATLANANPLATPSGFDYLGAGYNITKAGVAIIEALGKELPGVGNIASGLSLITNAAKLTKEYENDGVITNGTVAGLASDVAALAGGLGAIGLATVSVPAAVTLGVAAAFVSAGLTLASMDLRYKDNPLLTKEQVDRFWDSLGNDFIESAVSISNKLAEIGKYLSGELNDIYNTLKEYCPSYEKLTKDLEKSVLDGLLDLSRDVEKFWNQARQWFTRRDPPHPRPR